MSGPTTHAKFEQV